MFFDSEHIKPQFQFYDFHPKQNDFYQEVIDGLSQSPKRIPPKFFYDKTGSELFDKICLAPEYYPTRTELSILKNHKRQISRLIGPGCLLMEPGSGSSQKVRTLLEEIKPKAYLPLDISKTYLRSAAHSLAAEYPWLQVHAACVDYTDAFELPPQLPNGHMVAFFPGSTIGNFEPRDAVRFMRNLALALGPEGGLLIGVDLKKHPDTLSAAYNDASGITAAFNKNLLHRINRETGSDIDLRDFRHWAFYNEQAGRIEMHLVSNKQQQIRIDGRCFDFAANESIHTENSYKYHVEDFQALAAQAGFTAVKVWTDTDRLFSVQYFETA